MIQAAARTERHLVAELLKAEAERQLFVVPRRSMPVAQAIERIGVLAEDPAVQALGVMAAADALREQGRYAEALREYDRAGSLYHSVQDEVGWARTRLGAAYTRVATVELGPALEEAERARSILARQGLWVRLARLESAIGNLLRELGRTHDALEAQQRAAAAANQIADANERDLVGAEMRINRAVLYHRLDQFDQAEELLRSAAATFKRHARPGPVAIAESNLARGLAARGHVSRGLALASEVRERMLGLGRMSDAAIAGQVAVECLLELNRLQDAAKLSDEIAAQLSTSGADGELAKCLLQRAVTYERLERFTDAAHDLARAQALFAAGGCQAWAAIARLHHAQLLEREGRLEEALDAARMSAAELKQRGLGVASARADLVCAALLRTSGQHDGAAAAARAARKVAHASQVPLLEYQAWRELGEIADERYDTGGALLAFAAAVSALEKSQGRILTEQRAGFLHLHDKLAVYESAIRLCVRTGNVKRGFGFAERSKTRALLDALAVRTAGVHVRPRTPAARALTRELTSLRRRYDRMSSTLFDPTPQDELGASSVAGHSAVLQRELRDCEARIEAVLQKLRLTEAATVQQLEVLQGKIRSPLRYLERDTVLVQYAVLGEDILMFVLKRGQPVMVRCAVAGSAGQVMRARRLLELNIHTAMRHNTPALEQQARVHLQRLYNVLIQPVEDLIAAAKRLIIVPHGILHGIPFAALHDDTQFLVERCELVLEPSSSAIAFCRRKRTCSARAKAIVIAHSADGQLPGAVCEGEAVTDLLDATRLFEADATLDNVRQLVKHAPVVHIAAHGHSRPDAPLFSHIRLADGQLTALDCLDLALHCELVTLSACESGHAVVAAGDEPIGLTRSLLYAGVRSVIQSLWRVDDAATSRLMSDLYTRLRQGAGRAEALREAQRAFLHTSASHPAYWAAFALVGEWRPLK